MFKAIYTYINVRKRHRYIPIVIKTGTDGWHRATSTDNKYKRVYLCSPDMSELVKEIPRAIDLYDEALGIDRPVRTVKRKNYSTKKYKKSIARNRYAYMLRQEGLDYKKIGDYFGVSGERARQMVRKIEWLISCDRIKPSYKIKHDVYEEYLKEIADI